MDESGYEHVDDRVHEMSVDPSMSRYVPLNNAFIEPTPWYGS